MDLEFVTAHKNAKTELGHYPAILTSRLVNNAYIIITLLFERNSRLLFSSSPNIFKVFTPDVKISKTEISLKSEKIKTHGYYAD